MSVTPQQDQTPESGGTPDMIVDDDKGVATLQLIGV